MDGGFHFVDSKRNKKTKEEIQQIDAEKTKLAEEHGIQLFRIDSQKSELRYIKNNILNSKLSEILDVSTLDWEECERQTLTSLKLQCCELWKEYHNTKTISIKMKRDRSAIITWLKSCANLGLCDYDSKSEMQKTQFKPKTVHCIEYNDILPLTDACNKYNIKKACISKCCLGQTKTAGKLHWRYID